MKANPLLKQNLDALLRGRHESRKALAFYCRRSESWISKLFKEEKREVPLKYLDRIAEFFGLAVYELFLPGISTLTERRSQTDRRAGTERRVGHSSRLLGALRIESNKAFPSQYGGALRSAAAADLPPGLRAIVARHEREIAEYLAKHPALAQDSSARGTVPAASGHRRKVRGSGAETA